MPSFDGSNGTPRIKRISYFSALIAGRLLV